MSDHIPLKESLKNMLESEALTASELLDLQRLQQRTSQPKKALSTHWFYSLGGLAAGLLIMMFAFPLFTNLSNDVQQRIAYEVLTNHLHVKPLDVSTNSMSTVQAYMDRLNFNPTLSKNLPAKQAKLIGARYCTLQGVIAAQIKLKLPSGEIMTYYEAAYDPKRFGKLPKAEDNEKPLLITKDNFTMRMWQESNLVMVTAQQTL
ncbi:MAG: hypothetical protein ACKE5Q_05260 [Methylophilaceae bacterium]